MSDDDSGIRIVDEGNEGIEGYKPIKSKQESRLGRFVGSISGVAKQSGKYLGEKFQQAGAAYKQRVAEKPQREVARNQRSLEKMQTQRGLLQERIQLERSRGELRKVQSANRPPPQQFQQMPSMFGGMGGGFGGKVSTTKIAQKMPSFTDFARIDPWKMQQQKPKITRKHHKRHIKHKKQKRNNNNARTIVLRLK